MTSYEVRISDWSSDVCSSDLRIGEGVVVEGHGGALGAGVQALDSRLAAQPLDRHDLQQVVHLGRQRAEAVDQLGGEGVDLPPVDQGREPPVAAEAQVEVGDGAVRAIGRAWCRERVCK